ncbi:hypothetical protein LCGC14_2140290 [marine sediment metagenome]|uniref:Uncharacterized protein n=1 Tax=marine sediment metagenome TaxID=412755 RepID=A0A0F9DYV5_9ZZZZ
MTMIGFRVSEGVNSQLKELADKQGVTISAYVKAKVEDFVNKTKEGVNSVNTDSVPKQEKLVELRHLIANSDAVQSKSSPLKEESSSRLPLYNPLTPQIGMTVRMPSGEIVTVPELDAEGEPLPEMGSTGQLVSDNVFKPAYQPDPKPEKKQRKGRYARV